MKRLIPIVRDDVFGLFDRNIDGKVVLVTMDAVHLSRMLPELLDTFIRTEHKRGVVISYDRPAECIRAVLKKCWVPMEDLVIIDGATHIGGLPKEDTGTKVANIRVLEDPFDLGYMMQTLEEVLRTGFSECGPASIDIEIRQDLDRKDLEEVLLRAELEIYGIKAPERSIMMRRIMQRVKQQARDLEVQARSSVDAKDPRRGIPPGSAVSLDQWKASLHEGADFVLIENLAAMSAYFSEKDLDDMLRGLKDLISKGLCSSVLIFLDRNQYEGIVKELGEGPDLGYELEEVSDMGVQSFRFAPYGS